MQKLFEPTVTLTNIDKHPTFLVCRFISLAKEVMPELMSVLEATKWMKIDLFFQDVYVSGLYGRNCVCKTVQTQKKSNDNSVFQTCSYIPNQWSAEIDVPSGQCQTFSASGVTFQRNHLGKDYNRRRHPDKVSFNHNFYLHENSYKEPNNHMTNIYIAVL